MKEEKRVKKQTRIIKDNQKKSGTGRSLSHAELKQFTTHLSHF